jgi:hypothetical protein
MRTRLPKAHRCKRWVFFVHIESEPCSRFGRCHQFCIVCILLYHLPTMTGSRARTLAFRLAISCASRTQGSTLHPVAMGAPPRKSATPFPSLGLGLSQRRDFGLFCHMSGSGSDGPEAAPVQEILRHHAGIACSQAEWSEHVSRRPQRAPALDVLAQRATKPRLLAYCVRHENSLLMGHSGAARHPHMCHKIPIL